MASALVRNKRARAVTAAAPLANDGVLPSELLHDVLLRLPADALCRLRLVCRSWRSLTSDPHFAEAHAARHRRPLIAGVHIPSGEIRFMDLSGDVVKRIHVEEDSRYLYLSSHLDTVCISVSTAGKETFARVLNTATGASTVLPGHIPDGHTSVVVDRVAACMFILGHVPSTGELKVLRIHLRVGLRENRASGVYLSLTCDTMTLGNNGGDGERWRVKPQPPFNVWSVERNNAAAVVDGIAYFIIRRDKDFIGYSTHIFPGTIASFDLAEEKWGSAIQGPQSIQLAEELGIQGPQMIYLHYYTCWNENDFRLAALDGCLVTVFYKSQKFDCSMDLWFLEDVDSHIWTKRYSIRFRPPSPLVKAHFTSWYPVVVLDDKRVVVWDGESSSLRAYDTGKWEHLASIKHCLNVHKHEGSLLTARSSEVEPV